MRRWGAAAAAALFGLSAALVGAAAERPQGKADDRAPPRLAVLLVFDQFRGDYPSRWGELFGEGGLKRLMTDGAWFQNCHYPYAHTVTGAGHASLSTGTCPDRHGIFSNDWYERGAGDVYCAAEPRYAQVPPPGPAKDDKEARKWKARGAGSPGRLLAPTLADAFKEATGGKGKVVSLSLKDRGACLTGGQRADAAYWFDETTGNFVTSTFYRDRPHVWVEELNAAKAADRWFGKPWERLRPDLDYTKYSGPDDVEAEWKGYGQGRTFPHPMDGGKKEIGRDYYEALYNSPFGNDLLLQLVKKAVAAEKLGSRDVPDLLCLSFSCNDPVGHCWGPDSWEVLDTTLRTDRLVRELLGFLDETVGKGRYTVVLAADHGVGPLPEVAKQQGKEAGRIDPTLLLKEAEAHLIKTFVKEGDKGEHPVEKFVDEWFYFNRGWLKAHGVTEGQAEEALAAWLRGRPGVAEAYTRRQLVSGDLVGPVAGRIQRSFHADRSGDVLLLQKDYYLVTTRLQGTLHGTPYPHDTHVPLMVYGPGVVAGPRRDAVTPQAATAILARALGVKPPAQAEAPVPAGLFAERG
jgi:hypothetical protein